MKQTWDDITKTWKYEPETMAEYNAQTQPVRPSELPMPASAPTNVPGTTDLPPAFPPPGGSVGMLDPLREGAGQILASPLGQAATNVVRDVAQNTVPFVPALSLANVLSPDLMSPQLPMPSPVPEAPVASEPTQSASGKVRFSAEGAGAAAPVSDVPPQMPSMVPVKSDETSQSTRTEYGDTTQLDEATKSLRKVAEDTQALKTNISSDPEVLKSLSKQLAAGQKLEDLMDPNSDGFKQFASRVAEARGKIDTATKDLSDFQEKARVDPDRYWKSVPLLQHAMNSISILMEGNTASAAIRAGLPPPTGLVQARIDKAISDDISRQKDEIRMGEAAKGNEVNRYRDNLKMLGDERMADLKTKLDYQTLVKSNLESYMQKYQGKFDDLKMREFIAQLDMNSAKLKLEMGKQAVSGTRTESSVMPSTGQGMLPVEKQYDVGKDMRTRYDSATKPQKDALEGIRDVQGLIAEAKGSPGNPPNQAAANAVRGKFAKLIQGAGVLSDSDLKVFGASRSFLGGLSSYWNEKVFGTMSDREFKDLEETLSKLQAINEYALAKEQKSTLEKAQVLVNPTILRTVFSEDELEPMRTWSNKAPSDVFGKGASETEKLIQRREEEKRLASQRK